MSQRLLAKRIVLGVTGSIAAYKAVELLRALIKEGAEVSVVMTPSATRFVTPLTFEVLSKRPVATDLFEAHEEMRHLTLAEQADAIVIAPATAHMLAKAALGLADDLMSTTLLAARCPMLLAPAMDGGMWDHPTVQAHVGSLRARGAKILEPEEGPLASGKIGKGRLVEPAAIVDALLSLLSPRQDWAGQRILVSAGPTHEPIDAVRYIANRSSGKMGYAIAEAARARGASVVLVSGPTTLSAPPGVDCVSITTAEEMSKAMKTRLNWATVVVMAAAVGDFRPIRAASTKLDKATFSEQGLAIEQTEDILSVLSESRQEQILVGFAAETGPVVPGATQKLNRKKLDLIVGNDVTIEGAGFGTDTNVATLIDRDGHTTELSKMTKRELADRILDAVLALNVPSRQRASVSRKP
jgi:phosphopantothenoylcysteine decarboxylase / phosphopantothenate---cysteine ligase